MWKLEYLSNKLLDLTQILNLNLGDKTNFMNVLNEDDLPTMEDNLKLVHVDYLSNNLKVMPRYLKTVL